MSMQINVDPSGLTQEQREAVAGFILAYPRASCGGVALAEVHDNKEAVNVRVPTAVAAAVAANPAGAAQFIGDEIAHLAKEDGEFDASLAFGGVHAASAIPSHELAAATAFGSAPAPLPLGATAAPSIAGAAPSLTAPGAMPATTFTTTANVPVPPAPNSGPAAATAVPQTANHAGGVELDKEGFPWDARIHAESKAKIADGTWRKKRNLDPALKATVEAELRQLMAAPGAAPVAVPAPPYPPAGMVPQAPGAPLPNLPPPPVAGAPAVTMAAPNAAPPADARAMFVGLVGRASAAIQGGKVTQAEVNQCCAASGVAALPLLANRLDLVAQVAGQIDALIASRP